VRIQAEPCSRLVPRVCWLSRHGWPRTSDSGKARTKAPPISQDATFDPRYSAAGGYSDPPWVVIVNEPEARVGHAGVAWYSSALARDRTIKTGRGLEAKASRRPNASSEPGRRPEWGKNPRPSRAQDQQVVVRRHRALPEQASSDRLLWRCEDLVPRRAPVWDPINRASHRVLLAIAPDQKTPAAARRRGPWGPAARYGQVGEYGPWAVEDRQKRPLIWRRRAR